MPLPSSLLPMGLAKNAGAYLLITIHNPSASQIIRRKLDGYLVSSKNADKVLAHLSRNMRQHLVLVFQFHAKHGIGQRLDHGGHHFNGVLFRVSRVALLLFFFKLLHSLPSKRRSAKASHDHQDGPVICLGRVKIHGPLEVTATVCSKCAEGLPSAVSATHSSRMRTSGPPAFTIGSTAITMPSCKRVPRPGSP